MRYRRFFIPQVNFWDGQFDVAWYEVNVVRYQ